MNISEIEKIEKYLSNKNLPLDLYLEIRDHLTLQIEDLQRTKTVDFEDAFEQVQKVWQKELAFDSSVLLKGPYQIPKIVARIRQAYLKEIFPKILLLSVIPIVLLVVSANLLTKAQFQSLFDAFYLGILAFPFLLLGLNYKLLKIISGWKTIELNVFQRMAAVGIGLTSFPIVISWGYLTNVPPKLYSLIQNGGGWRLALVIFSLLYVFGLCFLAVFFLLKFKKQYNLTPTAK